MHHPYPAPVQPQAQPLPRPRRQPLKLRLPRNPLALALIGVGAAAVFTASILVALFLGALLLFSSGRILPGVSVAGIRVGGMQVDEAAAVLGDALQSLAVRDGERMWQVATGQLGLTFDAYASAEAAVRCGRAEGSALEAIFGPANVAPVFAFDPNMAFQGLEALAPAVDLPARNATFRLENGQPVPVPAEEGRVLHVADTVARLASLPDELADGAFDLAMNATFPTVTDASALVGQVAALLASPLTINAYNPVTDGALPWSIPPEVWGAWLTTEDSPDGVRLSLDAAALGSFLNARNPELGAAQYLKVDEAVSDVQQAIRANVPVATVRVYNQPTQYSVRPGETLGSIAWAAGVQMYRIEKANPGQNMDALSPGQTITIPSKDDLLLLPVVPGKRIVVSIAEQRMWVYENGQLKWDWPASTGIADSPTMPGVFQVISHDDTAYAGNWNLYMPYFMSIYEAVPGFYNGIHGFPWRNGSQILWENALGRRVTFGCILISTRNAELLYAWAADGVVTEIKP